MRRKEVLEDNDYQLLLYIAETFLHPVFNNSKQSAPQ